MARMPHGRPRAIILSRASSAGSASRHQRRRRAWIGLLWRIPLAVLIWSLWAAPLAAIALAVGILRYHAADLPAPPDLTRAIAAAPQTSFIVAADGTRLASLPFRQDPAAGHRMPVAFADLPPLLIQAFLAAEDERFSVHRGIDIQAIGRAALANLRAGQVVEGASTITQQVVRNLLPEQIGNARTLRRKIREALLAIELERRHSKSEIFAAYVNYVFLGAGAYGVKAASWRYFSRSLKYLDLAQMAMIAGMAQAPGRTDPYVNPEATKKRRNQVLSRMANLGIVDHTRATRAAAAPLALHRPPPVYGTIAPWFTEHVRQLIEQMFPEAYRHGGLTVETTAQPALALAAESSARAWSAKLAPRVGQRGQRAPRPAHKPAPRSNGPQIAALLWDHQTAYVEAIVGGLDFAESQFNRMTQACRQPGSAFKPIVFAAALSSGAITPATVLSDVPVAVYDAERNTHWKPRNPQDFRGAVLAHDALALSLNAPAIDVLDRAGMGAVVAMARKVGISTALAPLRPLALGASCVRPLELTGFYAAIARGGSRPAPVFVTRIRIGERTLLDNTAAVDPTLRPSHRLDRLVAHATEPVPAMDIDPIVAFQMRHMLRDVVLRGTASRTRRSRGWRRPIAGKTGTTNDNTDAWFVGFSHRLTAAVWLGYDDPSQSMGPRQDGGRAALPLWLQLLKRAEGTRQMMDFATTAPAGLEPMHIDPDTGQIAPSRSSGAVELWLRPDTAPITHTGTMVEANAIPLDLERVAPEF